MFESLFNPDNAFMTFINKIIDLVVLSLVFTICCIPIITIGPALAALYYAVVKTVRRRRSYPVKEFWSAFKSNMKRGIVAELFFLAFSIMMLWTDVPLLLTFINTGKIQDTLLLILFVIKFVILAGMACWIYPLMSRFDQKLWKLAQVSLCLLLQYLPITLIFIVLLAVMVILLVWEPLLTVVLPGMFILLLSFMLEPALRKLCDEEECKDSNKDSWYLEK